MFKRCNYPKGPPPGVAEAAAAAAVTAATAPAAPLLNSPAQLAQRLPLTEAANTTAHALATPVSHPANFAAEPSVSRAAAAEATCSSSAASSSTSLLCREQLPTEEEDPLFWGAVEGCMALFGGGGRSGGAALGCSQIHNSGNGGMLLMAALSGRALAAAGACDGEETENDGGNGGNYAGNAAAPGSTMPALLSGIGAVNLPGGKRLRSARCGTCRGCNSGDCGTCKNCLDKPKFGGPGCRKQACMARTCSTPKVVDDDVPEQDENNVSNVVAEGVPAQPPLAMPLGAAAGVLPGAGMSAATPSALELGLPIPPPAALHISANSPASGSEPLSASPTEPPSTSFQSGSEASPSMARPPSSPAEVAAAAAVTAAAAVAVTAVSRIPAAPVMSYRVVQPPPVAAAPALAAPTPLSLTAQVSSPAVPAYTPGGAGSGAAGGVRPSAISATKAGIVLAAKQGAHLPVTPVCATAASATHPSKYVDHSTGTLTTAAESIFGAINRSLSNECA